LDRYFQLALPRGSYTYYKAHLTPKQNTIFSEKGRFSTNSTEIGGLMTSKSPLEGCGTNLAKSECENCPGLDFVVLGDFATIFAHSNLLSFVMFRYAAYFIQRVLLCRLCRFLYRPVCLVALVGCLLSVGCTSAVDLRGPSLTENRSFELPDKVREPGNDTDFFGFSNKARQIEQRLGIE